MGPYLRGARFGAAIGAIAVATGLGAAVAQAAPGDIPGRGFLPDNRGWEKVSPDEKNGNDINPFLDFFRIGGTLPSPDGSRVVFSSIGAFADAPGSMGFLAYLGRRGPDGWTTTALSPPQNSSTTNFSFGSVQALTPDLGTVVVDSYDPALTADAQPESANLYRRPIGGAYELLTPAAGAAPGPGQQQMHVADVSDDGTRVLFESPDPLTADAPTGASANLYLATPGGLRFLGVRSDGSIAGAGSFAGASGGATAQNTTHDAMSPDGRRVVWTDAGDGQLYLAEEGEPVVHVSASQRSDAPGTPQPATYVGATEDLSKLYFLSTQALTEDAATNPAFDADLYVYDVPSGVLTDLSSSGDPSAPADVQGLVGISEDGSSVYFAANGALTPDATTGFDITNVYLRRGGQLRLVAALEATEPGPQNWAINGANANGAKPSRVSSDGDVLTLLSTRQLTGHDTAGTAQFYRYDAEAHTMTCVSCNPSASRSTASATVGDMDFVAPGTLTPMLKNLLTPDGGRVFFNTPEALVPEDTNGKMDGYVWQDGRAHLLTLGTGPNASYFVDASRSGDDAFIITRDRLVAADRDANLDIYDARVGGGFPEPAVPEGPCSSDCQGGGGGGSGAPPPPPPSASTVGSGNGPIAPSVPPRDGDVPAGDDRAQVEATPLSQRQQRRLAAGRAVAWRLRVDRPGRYDVVLRARIDGKRRTVGEGSAAAAAAGRLPVSVRLSKAARGELAERGRLALRLVARVDGRRVAAEQVVLRRPGRAGDRRGTR